ncbi:unnamed protein product [Prunus armeniaca]|uniref:Micro-fibrillar-associated protein 1 C-terminal domain-containing protein n=1 Tax=Prunus armeniaca TaxID=36596 RepID=A0A6J5WKM7_PRUAR|nr:unnamed protein product [Prunus armeniaca]
MSVTAGVSDTVIAVRDKLRGKIRKTKVRRYWPVIVVRDKLRGNIGKTKVKRYWPGKAPEWAYDADKDGDIRMFTAASLEKAFPTQEYDVVRKDDPRLRCLAESRIDNRDNVRAEHRHVRQAEIVSTIEEESKRQEGLEAEEEDADALEERRRRIKEKLLQREQEEAPLLLSGDEEEVKEEEEEESEYDTDSEKELTGMVMLKPVFVHNSERDTIAERLRLEAEERALEESRKKNLEERKRETKQIVVEEIRKGLEQEANVADIDTDDEVNEAEEYETWKARGIARIKRDRDDREAMLKENEEVEKVRNMTEEERRERERKHPKAAPRRKQKWRFMQKYYHKRAFFQSEADDYAATVGTDGIYTRDFSAPTGEDKMNKTILLKVMQVKHFGHSGRTKWTHLVIEDTTNWKNPLSFKHLFTFLYPLNVAPVR